LVNWLPHALPTITPLTINNNSYSNHFGYRLYLFTKKKNAEACQQR